MIESFAVEQLVMMSLSCTVIDVVYNLIITSVPVNTVPLWSSASD